MGLARAHPPVGAAEFPLLLVCLSCPGGSAWGQAGSASRVRFVFPGLLAARPPPGVFSSCLGRDRTFQVAGEWGALACCHRVPVQASGNVSMRGARGRGSGSGRTFSCQRPRRVGGGVKTRKRVGFQNMTGHPGLRAPSRPPESKDLILRWRRLWSGGPRAFPWLYAGLSEAESGVL